MKSKKILLALALVAAAAVVGFHQVHKNPPTVFMTGMESVGGYSAFPTEANAQAAISADFRGSGPVGIMMSVYNVSADTNIVDGDVCIVDTSATVSNRLGVRKLTLGLAVNSRAAGIAVGNIQKGGGPGKLLVWGYHPGAFVGLSNLAVNSPIKISRTIPGSFALADTIPGTCGWAISRTSAAVSSGTRYKYKVWFFGPRTAGATL